jgi:hypothetical protein
MTFNELTQDMAEKFLDKLPEGETLQVKFEGGYVKAAVEVGWLAGLSPVPTRKEVHEAYKQLRVIWADANELPNG